LLLTEGVMRQKTKRWQDQDKLGSHSNSS
jgi:hypothetical protein